MIGAHSQEEMRIEDANGVCVWERERVRVWEWESERDKDFVCE